MLALALHINCSVRFFLLRRLSITKCMKSNDGILDAWHGCVSSTYTKLIQPWQLLDTTSIISQMEVTKWWTRLKALNYYPGSFGHTSFFFSYTWLTCVISYRSNVLPIYHDCFTSISRLFNPISLFQPYITIVQTLYHDCTTPLPLLFYLYITIVPYLSHNCAYLIPRLVHPYTTVIPPLSQDCSTQYHGCSIPIQRFVNPFTTILPHTIQWLFRHDRYLTIV